MDTAEVIEQLHKRPWGAAEWAKSPLTEAQQKLVEDNIKYANYLAYDFSKRNLSYAQFQDRQDIYQEALLNLIRAARYYVPNRGAQFPSFAWRVIRTGLLNYRDKLQKQTRNKLGLPKKAFRLPERRRPEQADLQILNAALERLKPMHAEVYRRFFGIGRDKQSYEEIGRELQLTFSQVGNILHKKAQKQLESIFHELKTQEYA
jgi:RNA polymerase sigma factor (sigma-70 family)